MPNQCDDRKANENYKETRGGRDQKREREREEEISVWTLLYQILERKLWVSELVSGKLRMHLPHTILFTLLPTHEHLQPTFLYSHTWFCTHTRTNTHESTPTPTHKQLHKLAHMLSIQAIGSHTLTHAPTPTHALKSTSPCTHMHACTLSRQCNHTHVLFHFRLAFFFLGIDFCHRRSQDGFLPTRPCAIEASSSVLHGRMVVSRPKRCRRNNGTCWSESTNEQVVVRFRLPGDESKKESKIKRLFWHFKIMVKPIECSFSLF